MVALGVRAIAPVVAQLESRREALLGVKLLSMLKK